MKTIIASDWGIYLHRTARAVAALLVLLYVIAADLTVLAYRAGYGLGRAVHRLNDRLAAMSRPPMAPPALHPLAGIAEQLQELTVRELRNLTGIKRGRKAELIAALVAG